MDRAVAARKLIADLVKADQLQVRRVEIVARDLVKLLESAPRPPSGEALGEWLEEHAQVEELAASSATLDELVDRYLGGDAAPATAVRDPELERQIREDPTNATPYLVYADWLQERGDPLGELIALGVASASGTDADLGRFERHLKRHEAYLLGDTELATRARLQWRFGHVQAIDALGELDWQRVLGLRVCALLEALTLRRPCADAAATAIAAGAPPSLRALTLESLAGVLPAPLLRLPLRSLAIRATSVPFEIVALPASLERLELQASHVIEPRATLELDIRELEILATEQNLAALARMSLPHLAQLTFDLASTAEPAVAALANLAAPALTALTFRGGELAPATYQRLAALPLAGRLRTLGLVDLGLTDETLPPPGGFTALQAVDVTNNELTRAGLDAARALAPAVTSARQHRRGHAAEQRVRTFAGVMLGEAERITAPADWRRAGVDGELRWARYADYELFITEDLSRFGCTCESPDQPCKHVVALALVATRTKLPTARAAGIERRVTSRAGLADLLRASIED